MKFKERRHLHKCASQSAGTNAETTASYSDSLPKIIKLAILKNRFSVWTKQCSVGRKKDAS